MLDIDDLLLLELLLDDEPPELELLDDKPLELELLNDEPFELELLGSEEEPTYDELELLEED